MRAVIRARITVGSAQRNGSEVAITYARPVSAHSDERYERGLRAYASQFGIPPNEVPSWFADRFGERFGDEAINAAAGAWTDDSLTLRDRSLIVVAALIAQGGVDDRLRSHVRWAVDHGSNRDELEALATLLAVYVGFPRASTGMDIVREELDRIEEDA